MRQAAGATNTLRTGGDMDKRIRQGAGCRCRHGGRSAGSPASHRWGQDVLNQAEIDNGRVTVWYDSTGRVGSDRPGGSVSFSNGCRVSTRRQREPCRPIQYVQRSEPATRAGGLRAPAGHVSGLPRWTNSYGTPRVPDASMRCSRCRPGQVRVPETLRVIRDCLKRPAVQFGASVGLLGLFHRLGHQGGTRVAPCFEASRPAIPPRDAPASRCRCRTVASAGLAVVGWLESGGTVHGEQGRRRDRGIGGLRLPRGRSRAAYKRAVLRERRIRSARGAGTVRTGSVPRQQPADSRRHLNGLAVVVLFAPDHDRGIRPRERQSGGRAVPCLWRRHDAGRHGWEYRDVVGHWIANDRFPHGIDWLADELKRLDLQLGVWIAASCVSEHTPFFAGHPNALIRNADGAPSVFVEKWHWAPHGRVFSLDPTDPDARQHYRDSLQPLVDAGVRYYKVDFIGSSGSLSGVFRDPQRAGLSTLCRDAADRDVIGATHGFATGLAVKPVLWSEHVRDAMDIGNATGNWEHLRNYHMQLSSCWYKHAHSGTTVRCPDRWEGAENEARCVVPGWR